MPVYAVSLGLYCLVSRIRELCVILLLNSFMSACPAPALACTTAALHWAYADVLEWHDAPGSCRHLTPRFSIQKRKERRTEGRPCHIPEIGKSFPVPRLFNDACTSYIADLDPPSLADFRLQQPLAIVPDYLYS